MAKEKNVNFMFEASVGGGIPIIRSINECLTADKIEEITGILNGTTNYMLTKMANEGLEFADVLKDAQDKGYAENNATVRQTAKKFGISKSTVHKDVTERIVQINPTLAAEARKVLDVNKSERHIRGGMATKEKYLHQHI